MDLGLFIQVLWRSRLLVLAGFVAACALAVFALARPAIVNGGPTLVYRDPVVYQSSVQMLVTQQGYRGEPSTDPRFTDLAALYSQLIMGNAELQRVFGTTKPPLYENLMAAPMPAPNGQPGFLPIIQITGIGPSPAKAKDYADRAAITFSSYLAQRQSAARVAKPRRVVLERVAGPLKPTVYLPRKKTRAIFAFVVVLMLTIGAAFLRENARNRRGPLVDVEASGRHVEPVRQDVADARTVGVDSASSSRRAEPLRQNTRNWRRAGVKAESSNGRAEHIAPETPDAAIAKDQ